jgi:cell surface protein SprA
MYRIQSQKLENDYFNQRSQTLWILTENFKTSAACYDKLFDRMFGLGPNGLRVDIKPQGTIDLTMGYQGQVIKNPTLAGKRPQKRRLDFDMNTNLNINASIGDKLKFLSAIIHRPILTMKTS